MGVYISGMEMPKNCGECLLAKLSPTGESLICNYLLSRVSWEERPFDCPLVPVSPHGDLIDRDALCEGRVSNDNVVICAKAASTIIPAEGGET